MNKKNIYLKMAEAIFNYNGINTIIQCKIEDKMKDICEKLCLKMEIDINKLIFIYGGLLLNLELKYKEIVNEIDKKNLKMNILVYDNSSIINEKDIKIKFSKIYDLNEKIKKEEIKNRNEIVIIYKTEEKGIQKIFGKEFVKNNIKNIKLIINDKKSKLIDEYELEKGENKLKIIIKNNLTNIKEMFYECKSLYNIDELKYLDVSKCTNFSCMFYRKMGCIKMYFLLFYVLWLF